MNVFAGAGILSAVGAAGAIAAKMDEGNWGRCNVCQCNMCCWDAGSFGGKMVSCGLNNGCAFKRCVCGHHFTQHERVN